jgi:transposase
MRLLSRKRKTSYPSDLTDKEWALFEPLLPVSWKNGRPPRHEMREIINAIRYFLRTGCQWRYLPGEFPPWKTVYWWWNKWSKEGVWEQIHDHLAGKLRQKQGRDASPTAAIIDSQSVKASQKGAVVRSDTTPERRSKAENVTS